MNKTNLFKGIVMIITFSFSVASIGCFSGVDEPKLHETGPPNYLSDQYQNENHNRLRAFIDHDVKSINPIALEYVDNAKTILYATEALKDRPEALQKLDLKSYSNFDDAKDSMDINPMALRLQLLNIVDEDTGNSVNFYDLSQEQKEIFVDKLLQEDAVNISSKLALIPDAKDMIETENKVTTKLLAENDIPVMRVGDLSYLEPKNFNALDNTPGLKPRKNTIKINSYLQRQKAERKTVNQKIFFEK